MLSPGDIGDGPLTAVYAVLALQPALTVPLLLALILLAILLVLLALLIWRAQAELRAFRQTLQQLIDKRYGTGDPPPGKTETARPATESKPDPVQQINAPEEPARSRTDQQQKISDGTAEAIGSRQKDPVDTIRKPQSKPLQEHRPADQPVTLRTPVDDLVSTTNPGEGKELWVYPVALEEKLLLAVRSGDDEKALALFSKIEAQLSALPDPALQQLYGNVTINLRQLMYDFNESELDPAIAVPDLFQQLEEADRAGGALIVHRFIERLSQSFQKRSQQEKSEIVLQAKTFIEANYRTSLTVNAIAAALFISAPYLYRLMREEIGVSPAHYLTNLRIRHATTLLRHSDKTVAQIASEAGFETEQSFFRQFKKQMDCTPNQYRNRYSFHSF